MGDNLYRPVYHEISAKRVGNDFVVHKFGANASVGTTFVPISRGGVYQTPQVSGATTLRVAAGNANDTAAGTGAREVALQGLDTNGNEITEYVATAGTSASSATTNSFLRLYRAWVSESGTYATQTAGSHSDDIVIENGAGGTTWATIDATDFPKGQTDIAVYSIPTGFTGYVTDFTVATDATKTTDVLLFNRTGILQTAAPYDAMRNKFNFSISGGVQEIVFASPIRFAGPCDLGFMAKVDVGTAAVSVDFEIVVEQD